MSFLGKEVSGGYCFYCERWGGWEKQYGIQVRGWYYVIIIIQFVFEFFVEKGCRQNQKELILEREDLGSIRNIILIIEEKMYYRMGVEW